MIELPRQEGAEEILKVQGVSPDNNSRLFPVERPLAELHQSDQPVASDGFVAEVFRGVENGMRPLLPSFLRVENVVQIVEDRQRAMGVGQSDRINLRGKKREMIKIIALELAPATDK